MGSLNMVCYTDINITEELTMHGDQRQTHIAYIAGLLDSDGCFMIAKSKRITKNKQTERAYAFPKNVSCWNASYTPFIKLSQIENDGVEFSKEILKAGNILKYGARPSRPNSLPIYEYRITKTADIIRVLNELLPFLKIKKRKALHLLDYCLHRESYGNKGYRGLSQEELNYREDMYQKMRELNDNKVAATTKPFRRESVNDSLAL
jgi:hypothetical protein